MFDETGGYARTGGPCWTRASMPLDASKGLCRLNRNVGAGSRLTLDEDEIRDIHRCGVKYDQIHVLHCVKDYMHLYAICVYNCLHATCVYMLRVI